MTLRRLGAVLLLAAGIALIVALRQVEHKPVTTTLLAEVLVVVDTFGLRWQVSNMLDAHKDWLIGRTFVGWAKRRVLNRYGANVLRTIALPVSLLTALTILVLPLPSRVATFSDSVLQIQLAIYLLLTEVGFSALARFDWHARRDEKREAH